jgi:hypothetical protein
MENSDLWFKGLKLQFYSRKFHNDKEFNWFKIVDDLTTSKKFIQFEKNVGYSPIWKTPNSGTYLLKVNVTKTQLSNLEKNAMYIADLKLEKVGEKYSYSARLLNMVSQSDESED